MELATSSNVGLVNDHYRQTTNVIFGHKPQN